MDIRKKAALQKLRKTGVINYRNVLSFPQKGINIKKKTNKQKRK